MFRSFRSLLLIVQALSLLTPLLRGKQMLKLPFLLKELTFLLVTNPDLVLKFLEKRRWSPEVIKKFFEFMARSK